MVDQLEVEVVYHRPDFLFSETLQVAAGTTVDQVLKQSGLFAQCPELELELPAVGIYGRVVDKNHQVAAGDRIEVYRALLFDPKEARRKRAEEAAKKAPKKSGRRRKPNPAQ